MTIHTFLFQWKPQTTDADKRLAATRIRALQDQIPGIVDASYGVNTSPRSQGFTHGGVMKFRDASALEAYFIHPVHQKLVDWLIRLRKKSLIAAC